jgi:DNA-directed RNA polymerase specialized sigma24 family protein
MRADLENMLSLHLTPVYRLAIQLAPTLDDAADLTMLAFIAASRKSRDDEMTVHGPRIWLMRDVVRTFRSRRWSCDGAVGGDGQAWVVPPSGDDANPPQCDDPLDFSDEHLRRSIARLLPEFRAVLLLWSVEQFTDRQIAAVFDLPRRITRSWLRRARLLLSYELRRVQGADSCANPHATSHRPASLDANRQRAPRRTARVPHVGPARVAPAKSESHSNPKES